MGVRLYIYYPHVHVTFRKNFNDKIAADTLEISEHSSICQSRFYNLQFSALIQRSGCPRSFICKALHGYRSEIGATYMLLSQLLSGFSSSSIIHRAMLSLQSAY